MIVLRLQDTPQTRRLLDQLAGHVADDMLDDEDAAAAGIDDEACGGFVDAVNAAIHPEALDR